MNENFLKNLTIKKFYQSLLKKEFSCHEIISQFLEFARKSDEKIGAFLEFFDDAKEKAYEVDLFLEKEIPKKVPLLCGVPCAIKDNILIEGKGAWAASKILEGYIAPYDAFVIKKLKENKAIFLGRTNMDEFAMGSSCEYSAYKITKNPWDLERVPGGSSGGSAAAVASGQVIFALGSDTGGSIRQPAAFCGVVGLKPTYGSVSRFGLIAMASSLDQIGPITKTVADCEIVFNAIKGKDPNDATSLDYQKYEKKIDEVKEIKIGVLKEEFLKGTQKEVLEAFSEVVEFFRKEKFKIKEISLNFLKYALPTYYIIMSAEASSNLARYDGIKYPASIEGKSWKETYKKTRQLFGDEVIRRIILGTFVLSSGYIEAFYKKAQKARELIKAEFEEVFKEVDVILMPTSPTLPFKIGEKIEDPIQMYLSDIFTLPVNLAGICALNLPALNFKNNLPVGFQMIGNYFAENLLFELGKFYERVAFNLQ
ncbi:MAG TPA: Asp-tRNA(Asn)/Glu-tRNA(Gln) amidotransferase subunit GatA [bacterium]|nr:Asp-tRNA(Asn)/Glu-tRNA(Gln) amidotransferase subunit GatA [bacterium]